MTADLADLTVHTAAASWILAWLVVPLWIAAGFADWLCHRRADIEHTAGAPESLLHLLMFAELGVPLLAVLLLEVNALVFALMAIAFVLHEFTALWDVRYALARRTVAPLEQHVHSFLELLPLMGILLLAVLHPGQVLALFGLGSDAPRFELAWKDPPLRAGYIAGVLIAVVLLSALPYLEELVRGIRARGAPADASAPQRAASARPAAR
jgi:hypothetical protein